MTGLEQIRNRAGGAGRHAARPEGMEEIFSDSSREKKTRLPEWLRGIHLNHIVCFLFLAVALCWFPRYAKTTYDTLAKDKMEFFVQITLWAGAISLGVAVLRFLIHPKRSLQGPHQWVSATDVGVLLFWIVAIISWKMSAYPEEAYRGSDYRSHGLVILTMYVIAYFVISRFSKWSEASLILFLAAGSSVLWIALQNQLGNDVLGMYLKTYTGQKGKSISTLGNLNFFSSYVCMYSAVAVMLFLRGKRWYVNIFMAIFSLFGFCGLLIGNSDSGILGVGLLLLLAPMFARNFRELARYFVVLALFCLSGKVIGYFYARPGVVLRFGMSSFSEKMIESGKFWVLFWLCMLAAGICILLSIKWSKVIFPVWGKWIWFGLLAVAGVVALCAFLYYSVIDRQSDLGEMANYLRFSDWWGTHRGYAWRVAWQEFCNFKGKDLWVGTGADTAPHIYLWKYYNEMMNMFGAFFENVHNEFLQYLVTLGILGVTGYIATIVSGVARAFWRQATASPARLAAGMAVLCYAVQGIVNISQTMTTPIFFVLLGVAEGTVRIARRENLLRRKKEPKPESHIE